MLIVWSGLGFLPALFAGFGLLVGAKAADMLRVAGHVALSELMLPLGLLLAGGLTFATWRYLTAAPARVLTDPATGERVVLRRRHTLYWLPMQWWALGLAAIGGVMATGPLAAMLG